MVFPNVTAERPLTNVGQAVGWVQNIFRPNAAVALFGAGQPATGACERIASECFLLNRRVVIVSVLAFLESKPAFQGDLIPAVLAKEKTFWKWPRVNSHNSEPTKAKSLQSPGSWLTSLRNDFSSMIRDSAEINTPPGCEPRPDVDWMSSLRKEFDSVLLDCPGIETVPECAKIALMAQSALLAVEAGRDSGRQIVQTQRVLQSSGIRLDGAILIQNRREP